MKFGINNPNYKHGKCCQKYYCIDCNKEITGRAKRCMKCEGKRRSIIYRGKNNPNFDNHKLAGKNNPNYGKGYLITGKNHWNWQNGKSFEIYPEEFTIELKEEIRKRDNYTCLICHITEEEHIIVFGEVLSVHHIDYNKKNCKKNNLGTVCRPCNCRVNFNKKHWQNYFQNLLQKRGINV